MPQAPVRTDDGGGRVTDRRGLPVSLWNVWNLSSRGSTCAERDDAADGIVGGDANGDAIAGDDLDAEAAHSAAQLSENLMTRVALDAIQAARMDGNNGALHIY